LLIQRVAPGAAGRFGRPLSRLATATLAVVVVVILIKFGPALLALIGDFTLAAIIVFVVTGLSAGHLLGGPDPHDRTVLALSTATRHPGVALAIVRANAPEQGPIVAAMLLCLLAGALVSSGYLNRRGRARETPAHLPGAA
jgi:BASS family bile acid:Na+ symporter